LKWVVTLYPTAAVAQEAELSLVGLEDFVLSATFSDLDDPASRWRQISARQQQLVEWLAGRSRVEVRGPDVDLRFSIAERTFLNDDGHRNMPAGEIFTGPVEDSMEGWVRFNFPAVYENRRVEEWSCTSKVAAWSRRGPLGIRRSSSRCWRPTPGRATSASGPSA